MKFAGKVAGITRDFLTKKLLITFETSEDVTGQYDDIQGKILTIEAKKYRKRRSLDANAMLWACLGDIAAALNTDKWAVYLRMLRRYGKFTYIIVKPEAVESMKVQWRECEVIGDIKVNGQNAVQMLCYFGSSTYNTQEFSVLLEGVISEMKEMRLHAPTSGDMRRSLQLWEKQHRGDYVEKKEEEKRGTDSKDQEHRTGDPSSE